jgi:cysteine desulfuration protein SufE
LSTQTIEEIQDEIVEEFEMLGDWSEKYQHIIAIGKQLPSFPAELQTEENKVRGCQSNVWLIAHKEGENLVFEGDSDALIVKGLVALVLKVLSNHTPDEILNTKLDFVERLGLQSHLSPTRSNGLAAMIKQIKYYALAYKAKGNSEL